MTSPSSDSILKVFQTEPSIHVLAAALNDFFKAMYMQPQETWSQSITDTLLVPFLKRPNLPHACFFGERNPVAHQLLQPGVETRQNWFEWLLPLFVMEDSKVSSAPALPSSLPSGLPVTQGIPPSTSSLSISAPEPMESIAILLTVACLYWTFLNRSPEELGLACSEMQVKFEYLGWNEAHASQLRMIYQALITKIVRTSVIKNDLEHKLWTKTIVLIGAVEEFCFYSPLFGFGIKPDPAIIGLHLNRQGFQHIDLLRALEDLVLAQLSGSELVMGMDKKEKVAFGKQKEALEETGTYLSCALTWAQALKGVLETFASGTFGGKKEKVFVPGPADGSHVNVNDRVIVRSRQGKLYPALILFKGLNNDKMMLGVSFDDNVGGNDGTLNGTTYFTCRDGHGAFVRPDMVQRQDILPPSPIYDKAVAQFLEAMGRRPRFKASNKKQAKDCFDQAPYLCAKLRVKPPKHEALTATFADVPLESLLEHARVGTMTLKCLIRHVERTLEVLQGFVANIENLLVEDRKNPLGGDMTSCREALEMWQGLDNCLAIRTRALVAELNNDILQPFQSLLVEYELAAVQLKTQYAKHERLLETKRGELDANFETAVKDYQDFQRELAMGSSKRLVQLRQRCTASFVHYEQQCVEWQFITYRDSKLAQGLCCNEFQRVENKRLAAVQAWTQRYLASFAAFASPYPQFCVHEETLKTWSPADEIARFSAASSIPDLPAPLGKLPCTSTQLLGSDLSSPSPSSKTSDTPSPVSKPEFPISDVELQEGADELQSINQPPRAVYSKKAFASWLGVGKGSQPKKSDMSHRGSKAPSSEPRESKTDSTRDRNDSRMDSITISRSSISETQNSRTRSISDTPPPDSDDSQDELPPDEVRPLKPPKPIRTSVCLPSSPSADGKPAKPIKPKHKDDLEPPKGRVQGMPAKPPRRMGPPSPRSESS